jgi:hypothetical protein
MIFLLGDRFVNDVSFFDVVVVVSCLFDPVV